MPGWGIMARMKDDIAARERASVSDFDRAWLRAHLEEERGRTRALGEIREAIFGAQDGLVSTLAVVSTVSGATDERFAVLIAGIASGLAGIFSMSIGEYMSSKSQQEIFDYYIESEREEVLQRPAEAEAEVAYMLEEEGLARPSARRAAAELATDREVLLRTMVAREHGIVVGPGPGPLQGAIVMGVAFGLGALVPIVPFLFLSVATALPIAVVLTGVVLFAVGAVKSRWTRRHWLRSGAEIVVLAAIAGAAGYLFGSLLPGLLGVPAPK